MQFYCETDDRDDEGDPIAAAVVTAESAEDAARKLMIHEEFRPHGWDPDDIWQVKVYTIGDPDDHGVHVWMGRKVLTIRAALLGHN